MKTENYKVWWDKKNQIARAWTKGVVDEPKAEAFLHDTEEMARKHGGKVDWMLDMREITKTTSRARKTLVKTVSLPNIRKYALVGASVFIRTISNFILAASKKKNARHFATEQEALKWIKENK